MKMHLSSATIAFLLFLIPSASAQAAESQRHGPSLREHYEAAQNAQAAHQLPRAAAEYRQFLGEAIGEIAIARANAGQYSQAQQDFEQALSFTPHVQNLQMAYAEAAIAAGDAQHAQTVAQQLIKEDPKNAAAHRILGQALMKLNQNKQARQQLQQAVTLDPDFPDGYDLAVACLNLEDQNCAEKIFSEMTTAYGNSAALHMYFGQAYMDSDFQSKAVSEFQQAIALDPSLPGAHYSLAAAYLATQQGVDKAEDEIRKEIAVNPKNALAYAALGHLQAGQQNYTDAENNLQQAAALDPRNPNVFLYLGQLYAAEHKTPQAIAALRTCIANTASATQNHNQLQKAHYLLGHLLMQSGDTEAGKKELQAAQTLMQQNLSRARQQLASYYAQGSGMSSSGNAVPQQQTTHAERKANQTAQTAADALQKKIGPAVADSYNNLGAISASQQDYLTALANFEGAKEWNPTMPGLNRNLGRAAFAAWQFSQAVDPLTDYLQRHPDDKSIRSALGISLYMTKDYAKAARTLEPVAAPQPISNEVAYIYAVCLLKTGKVQGATVRLQSLALQLPRSEDVHRELGEAYAANGDNQQAVQELQIALLLKPGDMRAYQALGRAQLAEGQTSAAITTLQNAEKLAPRNADIHHDLAEAYKKDLRPQDAAREMQQYRQLQSASAAAHPE